MKFLWFLILFPFVLCAQQPSHFVIGERELDGVDIYDILQTQSGEYLVSTNNGIYQFNGYEFQQIKCDSLLGSSLFNLVEDWEGNVYTSNLNGQIVRVKKGKCRIFCQLPDSLYYRDIHLAFDNGNRLVVNTNYNLVIDSNAVIQVRGKEGIYGRMNKRPSGGLEFYSSNDKEIWSLNNGQTTRRKLEFVNEPDGVSGHFFQFDGSEFFATSVEGRIYQLDETPKLVVDPAKFTNEQSFRIYHTNELVWLASNSVGVYVLDSLIQPKQSEPLFSTALISTITEDREGNILLGTFGKGIIVIPKFSTKDLHLPDRSEVISLEVYNDKLLLGTRKGEVLRMDTSNRFSVLRDKRVKSVEALYTLSKSELIIGEFDGVYIDSDRDIELEMQVGSVKDVSLVNDSITLIATNQGVYSLNRRSLSYQLVNETNRRHYCVAQNPNSGVVYAGSAEGLALIKPSGQHHYVRVKGDKIMARDVLASASLASLYVATAEHGLLEFRSDTIFRIWNVTTGLLSDRVGQLRQYERQIIAATDNGVQVLDTKTDTWRYFSNSSGLNTNRILDLEVLGSELFVVHSKGVQSLSLEQSQNTYTPTLTISEVFFGDSSVSVTSSVKLPSDVKKVGFKIVPNTLKHIPELTYYYKLQGAGTDWSHVSSEQNVVEFQSLASGQYTFLAKSKWRGIESETVQFYFIVPTPFYRTWWFISLVFLVTLSVTTLAVVRRHRRLQFLARQENELISSKLTAIRSQMNPHFIFNALNSIQALVVKGDTKSSYKYLSSFSDLIRGALTNSESELVNFEDELKMLQHYVELEKLRFKNELNVEIVRNGVEGILVPPMLIQPFVENAIKHGLLHKEGEKQLRIEFELGEELVCTITDNGVGRKRANEIQERQGRKYTSFSTSAIERRFSILKRIHGEQLGFDVDDLEENGISTGTKVILRIPVVRKF